MSYVKDMLGDTPYSVYLERKEEYELVSRGERRLDERKEAGHHSHRASEPDSRVQALEEG